MSSDSIAGEVSAPKSIVKRLAPIGIILLGLIAFFAFGGPDYVNMEALREHKDTLAGFVDNNLVMALLAFIAAYAVLTAISFPGAWVLSVLGGFLFGTWVGGSAIVIGATIGATAIFLAARYAIGDFLKEKAGSKSLKKFEDGLKKNELSYLFILRLIPIFPFFVINFAPALFDVKLRNYIISTFFGIIPGSFVYASVGAGVGTVFEEGGEASLSGLMFQPKVIGPLIALIVLALIPVAYKKFKKSA